MRRQLRNKAFCHWPCAGEDSLRYYVMNLYKLMKMAVGHGLPRPVKLAGLAAMFRMRRRTAGVFLDPILSCNLRCRMCYFSDPVKRASMKGIISDSQLNECAKAIFPYALKLQIDCGAEPTLYPRLEEIMALGAGMACRTSR